MINKRLVNNVLKSVLAANETPEPGQPEQNISKPVQRWRYYFYDAPPESSIKFSYLNDILSRETPDRDATIKKLQGGNTGKYFADYFRWKKIVVATTEYSPDGNTLSIYEADLSPMGTKIAGSEKVYPEKANVTADKFEADLILFSDKRGNSQVINIDNSGESLFSDKDPSGNLINVLMNRTKPAGRFVPYNDFIKIFDEYRIWATNLNQLLLPNFDIPQNDDVQGGHYVGGQAAFNKLVGPVIQKMQSNPDKNPSAPSLKDKSDTVAPTEKSPFEPVDQQNHDKVKGDYIDNPGVKPMVNKFSAQDYKIQRMSRNVIAEYLLQNNEDSDKDSDKDAMMSSSTVRSTSTGTAPGNKSENFGQKSKMHKELSKLYDKMDKMQQTYNTNTTNY